MSERTTGEWTCGGNDIQPKPTTGDPKASGEWAGPQWTYGKPHDTFGWEIVICGTHTVWVEHEETSRDICAAHNAALDAERERLNDYIRASNEVSDENIELERKLAAEREKVEQLRESHACLHNENERLRERGWPDYPHDLEYQQLREQLATSVEALKRIAYEPQGKDTASHAEVLRSVENIAKDALDDIAIAKIK